MTSVPSLMAHKWETMETVCIFGAHKSLRVRLHREIKDEQLHLEENWANLELALLKANLLLLSKGEIKNMVSVVICNGWEIGTAKSWADVLTVLLEKTNEVREAFPRVHPKEISPEWTVGKDWSKTDAVSSVWKVTSFERPCCWRGGEDDLRTRWLSPTQ